MGQFTLSTHSHHTMRAFLASVFLLSAVTCRPDGPGHHHGHHGAHHGAHHADHGAAHHVAHGAPHHAAHGVHHATHTVGGVVSVAPHTPVHHAVHTAPVVHHAPVHHGVHSVVQPVSGHFSVAADPVHHAVHHAEPVHHAVHHADPVHHAVHANTVVKTVAPAVVSSPNTVAHLVSTNPKFSTLYTAVQAAGLVDILNQPGPYTVFAPTNTAFDKIPVDQLNALLEDKEKLKSVLMRHVIPGTVMAGKNFPPGTTTINTAAGEEVSITRDKFIQLESSAGSAYVVLFDQEASNGVVHA